nr:MAG TPA: hypothetical protein [Caudoviricetes sp.]
MKRAYLSGRAIVKIIIREAAKGDIRYRRYFYKLASDDNTVRTEMEALAKHNFINAKQVKEYLEKYVIF